MQNLLDMIKPFSITDALDIVIVAFVLYRMILLIRGTRAVQLLKGIVVILIMTGIAGYLNLRALKWILDKTLTIGLFAIPVVFQPELRRALETLGRGGFFTRALNLTSEEDEDIRKTIGELTKATQVLSKNRIGALIILERETGLTDYTETGISIDAIVTSELLINIFIPNTPLHDGAVMIRRNRVVAASCFLPLTDRQDVSKELGTRHRAALGMAEQSDAVSIIVSEETGQISVAVGNTLTRNLDEQSFREYLLTLMIPQVTPSGFSFFGRKAGS